MALCDLNIHILFLSTATSKCRFPLLPFSPRIFPYRKTTPDLSNVEFGTWPEALPWKRPVHYKRRHNELGATVPLLSLRTLEFELQIYPYDDFSESTQSSSIVFPNLVELKLHGLIFGELTTFLVRSCWRDWSSPLSKKFQSSELMCSPFGTPIPITPLLTSMISRSDKAPAKRDLVYQLIIPLRSMRLFVTTPQGWTGERPLSEWLIIVLSVHKRWLPSLIPPTRIAIHVLLAGILRAINGTELRTRGLVYLKTRGILATGSYWLKSVPPD